MDYYAIGQRIRRFRKANGLSQEELADRVGISTTHMSHIETGNTKLSLSVLVLLSQTLGVRTDDLMFENADAGGSAAAEEILEILNGCTPQQLCFLRDMLQSVRISLKKHFE